MCTKSGARSDSDAGMNTEFQTIAALVVVALAAGWLLARWWRKDAASGCGRGECGAVSAEAKKLRRRLRER